MKDNSSLFSGEILVVYLAESHEDYLGGIILQNPEIKELNGRLFIYGHEYNLSSPTWIPFEQVARFKEFITERDFVAKIPSSSE